MSLVCSVQSLALVAIFLPGPAGAAPASVRQSDDPVVARVNGVALHASDAPGGLVSAAVDAQLLLAACKKAHRWPSAVAVKKALDARFEHAVDPGADLHTSGPAPNGHARATAGRAERAVRVRLCTEAMLGPEDEAAVSDDEAAAWYEAHKARFTTPEAPLGRLFEIDVLGASDPAALEAARSHLATLLAAGPGAADADGQGPFGAGAAERSRPIKADDPAWGRRLALLAPGAVTEPERAGATFIAILRLPDQPAHGRPLAVVRADVDRGVRQERRNAARRALLSHLRDAGRVEVVGARTLD